MDRCIPAVRPFLTRGLTVIVYHEVTDEPSEFQRISAGFTAPAFFERQLEWIQERFTPIAPVDLRQLGGRGTLPANAALITFDDAWAGIFRTAIPILASKGIPSLCFVNMATVHGTPDLAAVRRYERIASTTKHSALDDYVDLGKAAQVLAAIKERYAGDSDFQRFQGDTATIEDVAGVSGPAWLASHLFHHWDVKRAAPDVFTASVRSNWEALTSFSNALPAVAPPWGSRPDWLVDCARALNIPAVFVSGGRQNRDAGAYVLDRLQLEPAPAAPEDWWWSAHRRRLFGGLAS